MDTIVWVGLGALMLVSVSVGGGLIIRRTQRTQKGAAFYVSLLCMMAALGYGVLPVFGLAGLERAAAYGLGAAMSVLVSQFLFGENPNPKG